VRVLFASHLFPNPSAPLLGTFVADLASAVARHAAVSVVAPVPWFPWVRPAHSIPRRRTLGSIQVAHPRRLSMPIHAWRWRTHLSALRRAGLTGPWTAIHSHWIDPDAYAVNHWEGSAGARRIATVHGHAALGLGTLGRPSHKIGEALRRLNHVVAVSSELRDLVINQFGVSPNAVSVHHNGIDPAAFHLLDREAARRRLGLALNRRFILVVARLSPEKRHDLLLQAIAALPDRDVEFRLVGDGPLRATLQHAIRQHGLENRVFLEGGIPHEALPDWFAAADLFCLCSAHEGCPVVVHEALACGVPIVSTRVGAVPDLVSPDTGILCPPGDAPALTAALSQGLHRSWDRQRIALRGQQYTWDALALQLLRIYQETPLIR